MPTHGATAVPVPATRSMFPGLAAPGSGDAPGARSRRLANHCAAIDTVADALVQVPQPAPLGSVVVDVGATVSLINGLPFAERSSPICVGSPWIVTVI
jgi:hypothetical protein